MGELGTLLVRAREARGLTLEDAERDTRISRRYLQALEAEQFDVIPAPVYARGFLRSYSQYLGLDPQEALDMFPRDDDYEPPQSATPRASMQQPVSALGAARPTWRRPNAPRPEQPRQQRERERQEPQRTVRREPPRRQHDPELPLEPMIGVDIGVPAPNRRIKTDPAAQTRSMVIAVVAIGAVVAVILLAFLISNLGGGDSTTPPGAGSTVTTSGSTKLAPAGAGSDQAGSGAAVTSATAAASSQPGVMPAVVGMTQAAAQEAIAAAGLKLDVGTQKSNQAKGTVIDQSPASGTAVDAGFTVKIVVSDGP